METREILAPQPGHEGHASEKADAMKIVIGSGTSSESVLEDLRASTDPSVVVFFCSAQHSIEKLSRSFHAAFPRAVTFGCTTAGEIVSGSMQSGSIVAMALPRELVDGAAVAVITDLNDPIGVSNALASLAKQLGVPFSELDPETHVGVILADGLSGAEERIIERLGDLTDLPFVGGSAGDDLAFQATLVAANGSAFEHAAVLAVLRVPHGYRIIKAQSFRTLGKILVATDVDEASRTVRRFNGLPAVEAYAQALGIPTAEAAGRFMRNPLGLMVGEEPYVRSPQRVLEDGSIVFYCQIRQGMELQILESTDMIGDTHLALAGPHRALLVFNCILRTLQLRQEGRCSEYAALFTRIPSVGFSTYGEAYMGHINQTVTMLAFE